MKPYRSCIQCRQLRAYRTLIIQFICRSFILFISHASNVSHARFIMQISYWKRVMEELSRKERIDLFLKGKGVVKDMIGFIYCKYCWILIYTNFAALTVYNWTRKVGLCDFTFFFLFFLKEKSNIINPVMILLIC